MAEVLNTIQMELIDWEDVDLMHPSPRIVRYDVQYSCQDDRVEDQMRKVITQFIKSAEGQKLVKSKRGIFNWVDAFQYIPRHLWQRYGIIEVARDNDSDNRLIQNLSENLNA